MVKAIRERYGIELAASRVAAVTERHAEQVFAEADKSPEFPTEQGVACVIGEIDGSMIPIVTTNEDAKTGARIKN